MRYTTEERNRRKEQLLQRMEAKRRVMGFAVGMCILLAVMISYALLQQNDIQRQYIYPYHYRGVIEKYSQQYQVDEYLVIAMVKTESKFQPEAVSGFGAMGLMQLMPETAIWISGQLDDTGFNWISLRSLNAIFVMVLGTWLHCRRNFKVMRC